jgi:histidinol-phosphatase (PHP family)
VLGSLHSLSLDGRLVGVGRLLYADPAATMRRYLGEVVTMIESSDVFQVLAHVDFPRRYWPGGTHRYAEKTYEEEYRAVFRALASTGRALEVNTSSPLASVDQVRWFHEEGGEAVSFGSDAHAPTAVGQHFDLAVDVVEAAGFRPGRDRFDFWRR